MTVVTISVNLTSGTPQHSTLLYVYMCLTLLNAELNPICYLLALLGPHHILHVSRIRINKILKMNNEYFSKQEQRMISCNADSVCSL